MYLSICSFLHDKSHLTKRTEFRPKSFPVAKLKFVVILVGYDTM